MASVADSTDPGTRRPNESSFTQSGTSFRPVIITQRSKILSLEAQSHVKNPFTLWQLFFPHEHINIMMIYTNSNARMYYEKCQTPYARARPWQRLTLDELYAFFAVQIYMGLHKEPRMTDYWNLQLDKPLHPVVYTAISCNRFQQIDRFFHVSDPEKKTPGDPFLKLEPLNTYVMKTAKELWQAGRDQAVDECMQRFQG